MTQLGNGNSSQERSREHEQDISEITMRAYDDGDAFADCGLVRDYYLQCHSGWRRLDELG